MKPNRLALAISRGVFLIDPRLIIGLAPVISDYMDGKAVSFFGDDEDKLEGPTVAVSVGSSYRLEKTILDDSVNIFAGYPKGSIAIIPIDGVIMQDDFCGAPGTNTLSQWMKDARDASNITSIILKVNSGGGMVAGTKEFSDLVAQVNQTKAVYAFCIGLMASAAYWIGCSCLEIWVSSSTVEIGSIGTAYKFSDNREAMKKYGSTQHYVNAESSPHKNMTTLKAMDGDYADLKALILNPTNDIFLQSVKTNRGDKLQLKEVDVNGVTHFEPLTGHVYLAETSIELGLIDGIKAEDEFIDYVLLSSSKPGTNKNNNMSKFSHLSTLVNKAANTITADELKLANEELTSNGINLSLISPEALGKLQSDLLASQTSLLNSTNELNAAKLSLTAEQLKVTSLEAAALTAKTEKEEVDGKLTAAEAKVTELENKVPGARKPRAISQGDVTHTQQERPLRSWEQKAVNKVGAAKE